MADGVADSAALFINLTIVLSYPVNFFIYCGMSRQFRTTFAAMFACSGGGGAQASAGAGGLAGGLVTTPGATFNRAAAAHDAPPSNDGGGGGVVGVQPARGAAAMDAGPATSSLLGRLRRSAVGAMTSSPKNNDVRLHSVSLLGNASPTDERQLDSGHL